MRPFQCLFAVIFLCSCCTARNRGPVSPETESASSQDRSPATPDRGARELPPPKKNGLLEPVVNKEYEPRVLALIESAEKTLRIVHFSCNDDSTVDNIIAALKDAANRGVDVQMLMEGDLEDNLVRVKELTAAGIRAKVDTSGRYTHAKLFVADRSRSLFGSTNLSYKSIRYNNETNLYIDGAATGNFFHEYSDSLWNDPEATPDLPPVTNPEIGLVRTLKSGDYVPAVTPLLAAAQERIDLLIYGYNLNPKYPDSDVHKLTSLIVEAHKRGVKVRILLEASDYNDTLNELNQVIADHYGAACIPVRFDPIDTISHAKLLLVDGTGVVGSNNWGHGGFQLYQEVGAVTDAPATVEKLSEYFDAIWDEGSAATPRCQ